MFLKTESAKQNIGRTIHDSYGRITGLSMGLWENVPLTWIEPSNGEFFNYPSSQITRGKESANSKTSWTAKENRLGKDSTTILRELSALNIFKTIERITRSDSLF